MEETDRAVAGITGNTDEPTTSPIGPTSPDELPPGAVLIAHTDGACSGNPGPGGWSVVFSFEGFNVGEFSGHHDDTTNNRMELTAVREAINRAPLPVTLLVVTDSLNVIGWLSRGWKRNNAGIAAVCQEIDALRAERTAAGGGTVNFRHVKGHNGDPLNERADALATGAIKRR
jgi:ribonuclease HI